MQTEGHSFGVNEKLMKEDGSSKDDVTLYPSLMGKLLYLTATRPDIMFAASLLSRFMHNPSQIHMGVGKRILRYLQGVFSWCSKKQQTVAQSSAEAEYVATALATSQAIGYEEFLKILEKNK
ncbi:uncharacterized mitochondrial protein-like protein [Tanacetum coccineum]